MHCLFTLHRKHHILLLKRDAGDESTKLSTVTALCQETRHTGASLNDLYDLLLNEQRSRSSDHAEVKSRLDRIKARLSTKGLYS